MAAPGSVALVVRVADVNGLRVYVDTVGADGGVFYSRRGDGPYYLWRFEEQLGQWRGSRLHAADFSHRALSMARWKIVPMTLQVKLGEHYLE